MRNIAALLIVVLACATPAGVHAIDFIRGDVNQDGKHDLADAIQALSFLFTNLSITCQATVDINDDGQLNLSDPISLLTFLFDDEATPPPPPFPDCGSDPTADAITCVSYNEDICPPHVLRIDSITPDAGPAEGGTYLSITGEGFSGDNLRVRLCNRNMLNVTVVTDAILQARTPAGTAGTTCDLVISNDFGQATARNAFTYESEPPPPCMTQRDMEALLNQYVGQSFCLPSPAWEGEIPVLGTVVVCPTGSGTCGDGTEGCEIVMENADLDVDLDNQVAMGTLDGDADLPIRVNSTNCQTTFSYQASVVVDFTLSDTEWENIAEVTAIDSLSITIDDLDVSASGGFVCLLIPAASDTLKDTLQEEMGNYEEEFLTELRTELVGQYICLE